MRDEHGYREKRRQLTHIKMTVVKGKERRENRGKVSLFAAREKGYIHVFGKYERQYATEAQVYKWQLPLILSGCRTDQLASGLFHASSLTVKNVSRNAVNETGINAVFALEFIAALYTPTIPYPLCARIVGGASSRVFHYACCIRQRHKSVRAPPNFC